MFTKALRPATHLIIVRHGHPDETLTAGGKNHDPDLSTRGRAQAQRVAERLVGERIDAIVSSPLKRAHQTAQALAVLTRREIEVLPDIAEVDGGRGSYETPEAIRARGDGSWEAFLVDPVAYFGGDTETFRTTVLSGFEGLLARENTRRIAVFTHGTPINALIGACFGFPELTRVGPAYCSITRVAGHGLANARVLSLNETGHFEQGEFRSV